MKFKPVQIVFVILILLASALLFSEPRIYVKTKYYNLYLTTESGLRGEMNEKGIRWTDGNTYDAFTSWYVKWQYEYYSRPGNCIIDWVDVSVDVEYTLPRWATRFLGGKETRIKWLKYIEALKKHEQGHGNFGISAARDIEKALLNIGSRQRCDRLGADANAIGYKILNEYRKKEIEYDRTTGHGRTQGAVFP
jgi:predicted secreted Zn-dependent protease